MKEFREYTVKDEKSGHDIIHHENCQQNSCWVCDGGLWLCKTCGTMEGALTTHCCGKRLHPEVANAVHQGKIDFVDGKWIRGKNAKTRTAVS